VMTERDREVWFRCSQCGHIVMPKERLFQCSCLKCFDLVLEDDPEAPEAFIH
jgi:hypothetical protein